MTKLRFKLKPLLILVALLAGLFKVVHVHAAEQALLLSGWQSGESVVSYAGYLGDSSGDMSLADVQVSSNFIPLSDRLFSFNLHTHWYKLPLNHRSSNGAEWFLSTGLPFSPLVRAYWVTDSGVTTLLDIDQSAGFAIRPVEHHAIMIPLGKTRGQIGTLYVENQTIAGYPLSLKLYEKEGFHALMADYTLVNGMLLGGLAVFFLFFSIHFIVQASLVLGLYCLFIFSMGMFVSQLIGYNFQYFWPNQGEFNHHFTAVIGGLTYVWYFLFASALFNLKKRHKVLYQVINYISLITFIVSFAGLFVDVTYLISVLALVGLPVPVVVGVWAIRSRLPSAVFYLAGTTMHCGLTYLLMIVCIGFDIGSVQFIYSLVSVGQVFDLLLFAVAIIYQTKKLREQLNTHLLQRIADMEAIVNSEKETQESQVRSQQHVLNLATTTHDLQQPLSALRMSVSMIEGEENSALKNQMLESLDYTRGLLNTVLHDTRHDFEEIKREVLVSELLSALVLRHKEKFLAQGVSLRVFKPKYLKLYCLPILLNRVLDNLLANALRYTDHGGALLGVRGSPDCIEIQVWDTGKGMPETKVADVMMPYTQLDQNAMDRSGFGLGLYIVKTLCDKAGYRLNVKSRVGKGSCFSIIIPID